MRFSVDSHTLLWVASEPHKLSLLAVDMLADVQNEPLLSVASAWEITIKFSMGKLQLPSSPEIFLRDQMNRLDIELLSLQLAHLQPLSTLPFHYKDPFDRLIIAQCLAENIPVLSADAVFDSYVGLTRLW